MPKSEQVIAKNSPDDAVQHMMWTTLTHHGAGAADQPWPAGLGGTGVRAGPAARAKTRDGLVLGRKDAVDLPAYQGWMAQRGLRAFDMRGKLLSP
jgi:hypothetical protein